MDRHSNAMCCGDVAEMCVRVLTKDQVSMGTLRVTACTVLIWGSHALIWDGTQKTALISAPFPHICCVIVNM